MNRILTQILLLLGAVTAVALEDCRCKCPNTNGNIVSVMDLDGNIQCAHGKRADRARNAIGPAFTHVHPPPLPLSHRPDFTVRGGRDGDGFGTGGPVGVGRI